MHNFTLSVGARGWCHRQWAEHYYPDEIPDDWRLAFYANDFHTLLATAQECLDGACDDWADETGAAFSLFIECADLSSLERLTPWLQGEQGRGLAGLVWQGGDPQSLIKMANKVLALPFPFFVDENVDQLTTWADHGKVNCLWRPGRGPLPASFIGAMPVPAVGLVRPADFSDDRALRELAQEFVSACPSGCRQASLFIDGEPPDIQVVQRASIMADLL